MHHSISKDDFVKAIEDVRSAERCSTNLNYFFKENKIDGYLFFPDCSTTAGTGAQCEWEISKTSCRLLACYVGGTNYTGSGTAIYAR